MSNPWTEERIIRELLLDHTGPQTPATTAAREYLGTTLPTVAGSANIAITARIQDLVRRSTALSSFLAYDYEAERELETDAHQLDRDVGSGLAVGRYLKFDVTDTETVYIIDRIEAERVHVQWLPNHDRRWADAVDTDGYVLRSVAEAQLARRDGRRG